MSNNKVLVVGASGFVGGAVINRLSKRGTGGVVGLSRRRPAQLAENVPHIAADLLDAASCRKLAGPLADITHVVYAAVNETPGNLTASWTDPNYVGRNEQMFKNLLDLALVSSPKLRQIILVHGAKAYAAHLPQSRPMVSLRESLPRPSHEDFYFRQEDHLWERQRQADWCWTIFRAPTIIGGGLGSNLNGLLAIAVFASLRKALGLLLPFPGSASNLGVMDLVDVDLFASAIDWSMNASTARNQIFNIDNGDIFVWPDLWSVIAAEFGLQVGESQPMSLAEEISGQAETWAHLVQKHGLKSPADWREFLGESAALADFALGNCSRSITLSTIKIRQAGFHECIDSAVSVAGWIRRWREEGLLPPC